MIDVDALVAWLEAQLNDDAGVYQLSLDIGDRGRWEFLLDDIAAKKRIIRLGGEFDVFSEPYTSQSVWVRVLRELVAPYRDRDGFDPSWLTEEAQ